jgi:hypothetical protein
VWVNLNQFLRFFERMHGRKLLPEDADEETAKEGFTIDHRGEAPRFKGGYPGSQRTGGGAK